MQDNIITVGGITYKKIRRKSGDYFRFKSLEIKNLINQTFDEENSGEEREVSLYHIANQYLFNVENKLKDISNKIQKVRI